MTHPFKNLGIYGYDYGEKTFYSDRHLGIDWDANFIDLKAPEDGLIVNVLNGSEGGLTLWFKPVGKQILIRWLHLSKVYVKKGDYVKEGQIICKSGNSGLVRPKPTPQNPKAGRHTHDDHWPKGIVTLNFKDTSNPRDYYKQQLSKTFMKLTLVANRNDWTTLAQKLAILNEWFKTYSANRLEVVSDIKHTSFTDIPFQPWESIHSVDVNWYRSNITPLATGHVTLLLVNPAQWKAPTSWGTMTFADTNKPVRCEITSVESEGDLFISKAFHEICHALFHLTGQQDRVHEFLYQNPPRYVELLNLLDYQVLQNKLVTINQGDPMLIYKFDDSGTQYVLTDDATLIGIASGTALTKTLKGRPQKLVVMPASQRSNFVIADSAIN